MASIISKGSLFPPELTNEMFNLVRGKSSLARLSASAPIPFDGIEGWTFTMDNEVNIVAENGAKSNGGVTMGKVAVTPVKVEYGVRISDEFRFASEEIQLQYLRAFSEGFANKVARGLDIMALHGLNPRTRSAATGTIGNNHFDYAVTQAVALSANPSEDIERAVEMVQSQEHEVTGIAASLTVKSGLAALRRGSSSYEPLFPELAWGGSPERVNGMNIDFNSTVNFNSSTDRAIVGNFRDFFRWGFARQIPIELIEYGNPDNDPDLGDLKGHNQVYLRGEAYIGWGIIVPAAFARVIQTTITLDKSTVRVAHGSTTTVVATTVPSSETVTWTSSNPSKATVEGGVITGVAAGSATITASAGGASATVAVTVT